MSLERPDIAGASDTHRLSGMVATAGASTLAYITKEDLAFALAG